jgi:hypothetical protein
MPEQLVENDNGVPPSDDKHLHAMGTRVQDLSSEKEWREFEIERWRSALRRGLRLSSLDPEHQRALFERIQPALGWRDRFFLSRPRLAKRLHLAARAALAVALVALGYGSSYVVPVAGRWTHGAIVATLREQCVAAYAEMPQTDAGATPAQACGLDSGGRP